MFEHIMDKLSLDLQAIQEIYPRLDINSARRHTDKGQFNDILIADRISSVIDFTSAGPGDQAVDLAALSTLGGSFFRRFCKHYASNASVFERAKFYRMTFALQEALGTIRNRVRQAFRRGMEQYI